MSNAERPRGIFTIDATRYLERSAPAAVQQLGDGLWTAAVGDHRTLFAQGGGSILACNTFGTPAAARVYRDAIEQTIPGHRVGTLLCTIDHLDHAGYGTVLAPEAEVVAHELCAGVLERRRSSGQRTADRVIEGTSQELNIDGVTVRAVYPGPTVGTGNLALHVPAHRALFVVGPRADARYGLLPDMHFRHLTRIWRELAEIDVDVVIPGRGALMDRDGLRRAADYLDAVAEASQRAFAQGLPIWELPTMHAYVSGALRDRFGDLDGFDDHVGVAAIRLVHYYLMGGWGIEDTAAPERLLEAGR